MLLLNPLNGRTLRPDGAHTISDGVERYPCIDGIAFLRHGRDALREQALGALDDGDAPRACALLLQDQDDYARTPPPSLEATGRLVAEVARRACTLREAMDALAYGPVATYFAHRTSTPTFLSALGLLDHYWRDPPLVLELACGIGWILREVERRGAAVVGIDVVFSKLWLARHFVTPQAQLVCADVEAPLPLAPCDGALALCHDAFYFMRDKPAVVAHMRRFAGPSGAVLIGHTHNSLADPNQSGAPLAPAVYHALAPDALVYDDADFTAEALGLAQARAKPADALGAAPALSLAIGAPRDTDAPRFDWSRDARLRLNPLLKPDAARTLAPHWPDARFAAEYGAMDYLRAPVPTDTLLAAAGRGERSAAIADLARRRVLIDLPTSW